MSAAKPAERFAGVPDELKAEASWVLWRYEHRDGKPTKAPRQTNGRRADSTKPETWTTFAAAVAAYVREVRRYRVRFSPGQSLLRGGYRRRDGGGGPALARAFRLLR